MHTFSVLLYFIIWQGKSERSDLVFSWSGFRHTWKRWSAAFSFLFSKAGKFKTSMARVPYNKLLTNLPSSSRTGEYWPSVFFVRTSGQYSPIQPSRSVSKGQFTWRWGTPGRWGTPPTCGKRELVFTCNIYNPGALGWGFEILPDCFYSVITFL